MGPGDQIGPYLVHERLGGGAMGEVYRARDERLGRDVAVKVLTAMLAPDPANQARFEREAHAAGTLNHPNILIVHDIGRHQGVPYLVSELLEGETLRARLNRGPLPFMQAVEYAKQIANGLSAAHERRIIHRDLKPENLFLTTDGRLKILDFGLARELPDPGGSPPNGQSVRTTEDLLGAAGRLCGTPGYMPPEQVRGEKVDHWGDLFALGSVLFEMVCGRPPFAQRSTIERVAAVLSEAAPDPVVEGAALPPGLVSIIRRCLAKDPENRFTSAGELSDALDGILRGTVTAPARGLRLHRTALLLAVAGLAVAAAFSLWIWRHGASNRAAQTSGSNRIVVTVFENQTGDASLDAMGRMTSDWITQGLSRIKGVEAVPSTSVLMAQPGSGQTAVRGRRERDPIHSVAELTGAQVVVSGEYYLRGDSLDFHARVTDAAHHRLLTALEPALAPRSDPLRAIDMIRQRVMGSLALVTQNRTGVDGAIQFEVAPPRYDAYLEFITGFEQFMTDDAEALRHFERATELDPSLSAPWFYMTYIFYEQGEFQKASAAMKVLSERRGELSDYARHSLDALIAYAAHRYPDALQSLHAALALAPQDPMVVLWVAYVARLSNRPEETIEVCATQRKRPWGGHRLGSVLRWNLCAARHALGQYTEELKDVQRDPSDDSDPLGRAAIEVRALIALGREAKAREVLERSLAAGPAGLTTPGELLNDTAAEARAHGSRDLSVEIAAQSVAWYQSRVAAQPDQLVWRRGLLDALRYAERWDEAAAMCDELLRTAPEDPDVLGLLGTLAAHRGEVDTARRIDDELARLHEPYLFGKAAYHRAGIAALLGDPGSALALLRESHAEGLPYSLAVHREIDFEPLWSMPAFKSL